MKYNIFLSLYLKPKAKHQYHRINKEISFHLRRYTSSIRFIRTNCENLRKVIQNKQTNEVGKVFTQFSVAYIPLGIYASKKNWISGKCNVKTLSGHSNQVRCLQFDHSKVVASISYFLLKNRKDKWFVRPNNQDMELEHWRVY